MKAKHSLYRNLRSALVAADVDLAELAKIIGVSYCTATFKMNGKATWDIKEMKAIQEALNRLTGESFTLDYLFTE